MLYKLNLFLLKESGFDEDSVLNITRKVSNLLLENFLIINSVRYLGKRKLLLQDLDREAYFTSIIFKIPLKFFKNKVLNYIFRSMKFNLKLSKFFVEKLNSHNVLQ
jgi:hypothetical protein